MATSVATNDEDDGVSGEYQRPDAAKAFHIYDEFIAPKKAAMSTLAGDCSEPWQGIKKHAHFPRSVMNFIIALENIDDETKRDHHLLALAEGLRHRKLFMPSDLVTMADGSAGEGVVPAAKRKPIKLATVDGAADDAFEEMSDEERAAQAGRPSVEAAKAEDEAAAEETALAEEGQPKSQFERMYEATHGEPPVIESPDEPEAPAAA